MKSLNIVIKTLVKINIFAVIAAFVTVIAIREQQTAATNEQQKPLEEPIAYRSAVRENPLERKVKELKGELKQTSKSVEGLIAQSRANSQNTRKTDDSLDKEAKNLKPSSTLRSFLIPSSDNYPVVPTTAIPQKSNPPDTATKIHNREQATNSPDDRSERTNNTADQTAKPTEIDPKSHLEPSPSLSPQTRLSSSRLFENLALDPSDTPSILSKQQIQTIETTNMSPVAINLSSENREIQLVNPIGEQSANRNNKIPETGTTIATAPAPTKPGKDQSISYANDLAVGLLKAANTNSAQYQKYKNVKTLAYRRVQTAIVLLRNEKTIEEAARLSNVDKGTLKKLIKLGKDRPGKPMPPTEISLAEPDLN